MSDTPRMERASNESIAAVYEQGCQLERELAEVTKQRDAAIASLEKIASLDFVISLPDRMDAVRDIARETLNKLQP